MRLPNIMEQFKMLIGLPSVSCTQPDLDQSNAGVVHQLAEWLEPLGFACNINEVEPGKLNLIARRGSGPGGLVLSGHTDTVPFDEALWNSDPLGLIERDDRWYGLGTCDMKGFFPLVIEAVRGLADVSLSAPLTIIATCDEESSMSGARALVDAGHNLGEAAIIGEPTGLKPIRLHKGVMMEKLEILGQSGHSSDPSYGRSALDAMYDAIGALIHVREGWKERHIHSSFAVPHPTLNLGCIHGGDNPNRICGQCSLEFDVRPIPGMDMDRIREEIDQRLGDVAAKHRVEVERRTLFPGLLPFEEPTDSGLITLATQLTGAQAEAVAFGTEAPYLQQLGLETIILGPGDIACAHQPDEYLDLSSIEPTIELLRGFIHHYCSPRERRS